MFGALLLSAPATRVKGLSDTPGRNRNLFMDLILANAEYVGNTNQELLLMSTVALDDNGARIKTGSTCAPVDSINIGSIDPYPESMQRGIVPPDPYAISITDYPVLHSPHVTPDVLAYGQLHIHSVPTHCLGIYTGTEGDVLYDGQLQQEMPTFVLDNLINDVDPDANFITKAQRGVLDKLGGRFVSQVLSAGPDPFLMLLRRERPLYLNFVERSGCFYLVWSDFELSIEASEPHRPYTWPLLTFSNSAHNLTGFSIRMLRNRWTRWLTPKVLPTRVEDVDLMRVPRAIAALQQWLLRRTI